MIQSKQVTAVDVLESHLTQIECHNNKLNAIVTLDIESAMCQAERADQRLANGEACGPLHGLPIAHKDLVCTKGMRTTFGSPIFKDFVPDQDDLIVERYRAAGAVLIGKTNTPEFAAGSQTFNPVFGKTLNPYDPTKTCGGSSGGAAVALATGMLPIADGSDLGGSLRNPASFCNVVGFRPSPGRVPSWPFEMGWSSLMVQGPMARTVEDIALQLTAIAGPDARSPIAIEEPGRRFAEPMERDFRGVKIAWSENLGGLPVAQEVTKTLDSNRSVFSELGCHIENAEPNFVDADQVFQVLRAFTLESKLGSLVEKYPDQIKETVIWNVLEGKKLTGPQIAEAEVKRTRLYHRLRKFLTKYEFLILPVSQVAPFDVELPFVKKIDEVKLESYIDWMKSCYYLSVTGLPSISVPCGFTASGLPVGIQIVGRHHADFEVLQLAYAFQQATEFWKVRPA